MVDEAPDVTASLTDLRVSGAVASAVCGFADTRRLRQLVDEGWIKRGDDGLYRLGDVVQGYVAFLKSRQQRESSERSKLERTQRAKLEMQLQRQRGELVPTAMMDDLVHFQARAVIGQLEGLPSRRANELAGISDPAVIRDRLQDDVRDIRTAVAEALERYARDLQHGDVGSDDGLEAAKEADAGAVGGREPDLPAGEHGAGPAPQ